MAIPNLEQWLNKTICDTQPPNSEEWLNEYYCIPGYRPNVENEPRSRTPALTQCIEIVDFGSGPDTERDEYATGIGNKRYFFDNGAIDKNFHETRYNNVFITKDNIELYAKSAVHYPDSFKIYLNVVNQKHYIWK